jgi:glycosyltransferase involved in cell wall biosynthesis
VIPQPLVTTITIFRNAPIRFFEEAIASVRAQTETRWELLLVDDGSTDDSPRVAHAAAAADPERIRVLTHPGGENRGMSASRNLGIAAARGGYVAFLDADDLYLPQKLERQLAILQRHPDAAIVYGPTLHWWSWTGDPADAARDHPRRLGLEPERVVPPPNLVRAFLGGSADTPATCAVLIRRDAIDEVGAFEPTFIDLYEDQAFFYKLLLGHSAYLEPEAWDRYRRHPAALCEVRIREGLHADDASPTAARGFFLDWLEDHFRSTGIADEALWSALRRQRSPFVHPRRYRLTLTAERLARAIMPASVRRHVRQIVSSRR